MKKTASGSGSSRSWSRLALAPALSCAVSFALAGCLSQDIKDNVNQQVNQGMRTSEVGIARHLAASVARREDADVSATATVTEASTSASPVVGHPRPCTSGRLLHITLVGEFPHQRSLAGSGSALVVGQVLTVDAATGRLCESHYVTGPIVPDPMSVALF